MLDSCRNDVISYLLDKGLKTGSKINDEIHYYSGRKIVVSGPVLGVEFRFTFESWAKLKIEWKPDNEKWVDFDSFDYYEVVEKDIELIKLLDEKIFHQ